MAPPSPSAALGWLGWGKYLWFCVSRSISQTLRAGDPAGAQERRDCVTPHNQNERRAHGNGQNGGNTAVKSLDRSVTRWQCGNSQDKEKKGYDFVPEGTYGFYNCWYYVLYKLPALGSDVLLGHKYMLTNGK